MGYAGACQHPIGTGLPAEGEIEGGGAKVDDVLKVGLATLVKQRNKQRASIR